MAQGQTSRQQIGLFNMKSPGRPPLDFVPRAENNLQGQISPLLKQGYRVNKITLPTPPAF